MTNDEVAALLGVVRLEMVCDDITKAQTDVIVNTTGFQTQNSGMVEMVLLQRLSENVFLVYYFDYYCYKLNRCLPSNSDSSRAICQSRVRQR